MSPTLFVQELFASSEVPLVSAFLLGLLVALSPCPLTTNLAALAYIGRYASDRRATIVGSTLYSLGRMASYSLLVGLVVLAGGEVARISGWLQDVGEYLLGPILLLAGLAMLGLIRLPTIAARASLGAKLAESGSTGAFGVGALFALAFCPYSAALFFGVLVPLAMGPSGGLLLAPSFALGTGLPVLVAALALSLGVTRLGAWLSATGRVESVLRKGSGLAILGVGGYLTAIAIWSAWSVR